MRPIKFREWVINDLVGYMTDPTCLINTSGDRYYMQYTGIKDSHGVEIYEGDIIAVNLENGEDGFQSVVRYFGDKNYPAFDIKAPDGYDFKDNVLSECIAFDSDICVVGNIYENPEMLEDCE